MASAAQRGAEIIYESQEVDMQEEIDEEEDLVYTVHVEVRLKRKSTARMDFIKHLVLDYLSQDDTLFVPSDIMGWEKDSRLVENVERMAACETCE
jgi:hypothetical protein